MKKTSQYESFFSYAPDYLEFLRLEKKSPRTISTYGFNLNDFKNYLVKTLGKKARCIEVEDVDDNDVRRYLSEIVDKGQSLNTRNARLNTVRRYIDFCANKDIRFVKLAEDVAKITSKPVQPEDHLWLTKEQMELVLKQPKRNRLGIRDRMILLFLFGTGARLREFRHITLDDLVLDGNFPYVRLYGKGDKTRVVPITKELKENLEYYISLFHKDSDKNTPLFYTKIHGQIHRMSDDNVQRICSKYGNMAREKDPSMRPLHPHLCRHSYAALNYRSGMSMQEIANLLGHSDTETTERYAETDPEMLNKIIREIEEKRQREGILDRAEQDELDDIYRLFQQ